MCESNCHCHHGLHHQNQNLNQQGDVRVDTSPPSSSQPPSPGSQPSSPGWWTSGHAISGSWAGQCVLLQICIVVNFIMVIILSQICTVVNILEIVQKISDLESFWLKCLTTIYLSEHHHHHLPCRNSNNHFCVSGTCAGTRAFPTPGYLRPFHWNGTPLCPFWLRQFQIGERNIPILCLRDSG